MAGALAVAATVLLVELTGTVTPPVHERQRDAEARSARLLDAQHALWTLTGSVTADPSALESGGVVTTVPFAFADPHAPEPLQLRIRGRDAEITSVGPDGRRGTADDLRLSTRVDVRARALTHQRLVGLRLAFLEGPHVRTKAATPELIGQVRTSFAAAAVARRALPYLTGSARQKARRELEAAEQSGVLALTALGGPALPARVRGPGGLLDTLGLPDALGRDAFGRDLIVGPLGFASAGRDGKAGTDDDL